MASSRLMMTLSKATLVVVDIFSTQDLGSLVGNLKKLVMMGQHKQYLMVCRVKVVHCRWLPAGGASRTSKSVSSWLRW